VCGRGNSRGGSSGAEVWEEVRIGMSGAKKAGGVENVSAGWGRRPTRRGFLAGAAATAAALPLAGRAAQAGEAVAVSYRNPLGIEAADPYVLRDKDGLYYLYSTGGGERPTDRTAFPCFVSNDLVNWRPLGEVYQYDPGSSWGIGAFWAPEVYLYRGRYWMVFSAQWRENPAHDAETFRVGVAVADSPRGPFRNLYERPIFDPGYPIIDADLTIDDDGRVYLYYSRCCYKHEVESEITEWARARGWYREIEESWIYGVELKPDLSGTLGEPVELLRPPVSFAQWQEGWENRSVLAHEVNRRWTEGPCSLKHDGRYYLMYSANSVFGPHYALGYATAEHPLGPFTKAANNPVAEANTGRGGDVTTTAHNCVTRSPDGKELYCLYGGRTTERKTEARILFLCRMEIHADGVLEVEPPDTGVEHPYPPGRRKESVGRTVS
jgi:GH43 family beta-xylosidase